MIFVTFSSKTDIFYDRDTVVSRLVLFVWVSVLHVYPVFVRKPCRLITVVTGTQGLAIMSLKILFQSAQTTLSCCFDRLTSLDRMKITASNNYTRLPTKSRHYS